MLSTPRLALRPWRTSEAERLLDIRSRPDVAKWLSSPEPWTDLARAKQAIAEWEETTAADDPFGTWAIVPTDVGVPCGSVLLDELPGSTEAHTGWYLHPDSTGRGYAVEGASAVLRHGFNRGVRRIWAIMWPSNEASAAVARSLGMTDLGVCEDPWFGTDDDPDSLMFRLDAPGVSL